MKTKKKIVHYKAGTYLPISENWIYFQIKGLKQFDPIVYCFNTENLETFSLEHIRPLRFYKYPLKLFNHVWILNCYLFTSICLIIDKPLLIHAHFSPSGYSILKLKKFFKIPLITTFYGYDVNALPTTEPEWKEKYRQLFKEGECFLVEGNHMKKCLVKLGCPEEKIKMQHLGVDLQNITYQERKIKDGQEIKILISGRFTEKKGIPYAVEAIGKLKKMSPNIKLSVTILGDSDGSKDQESEKDKISETINKYGIAGIIRLLGYQPHAVFIKELYNHHLFLSPSITAKNGDTEGGVPVAIIEASASGMPVVATNHCDIPEVIINNISGHLVPERDSDALAEKLKLLIDNADRWGDMGIESRQHIENNYDINKQIQSLEKVYFEVISNKI